MKNAYRVGPFQVYALLTTFCSLVLALLVLVAHELVYAFNVLPYVLMLSITLTVAYGGVLVCVASILWGILREVDLTPRERLGQAAAPVAMVLGPVMFLTGFALLN